MKKLISIILACLPTTLLMVGCSETENSYSSSSKKVTITAQMPESENTRAALSEADNSLNLLAKWQSDDKIQLIITQGNQKFEIGKVPIANINSDGKKASFSYDIPDGLDVNKKYMLYAFCGISGYVDKNDKGNWSAYCTAQLLRTEISKLRAPIVSCTEISMNSPVAQFKHFQTYEVLHIKNSSSKSITFIHEGFKVDNPWYRGVSSLYDFGTWSPGKLPVEWKNEARSESVTIPTKGNASIISCYLPSGYKMKDAYLKATINGKNLLSANKKSSDFTLQTGHAYHMYATWDGTDLKFDKGDANEVTTISVSPEHINFKTVEVGKSKTETFIISNTGNGDLTFEIESIHSIFDIPESGKSLTLKKGESKSFSITFTPHDNGYDYSDVISIVSNASNGTQYITVVGKAGNESEERLNQVIPEELRDRMDDYIPIYDGSNPPNIEGEYIISPMEMTYDSDGDYETGHEFLDTYIKFFNQDMINNTLDYQEKEGSQEAVGKGCFISGEGNKFSVFFNTEGITRYSYDINYKTALVISGIKTDYGIEDLYYAFVMVDKDSDPSHYIMEVGDFRVFRDGDGLSYENYWSSYAKKHAKRKNKTLPSILEVRKK